LLRKPRIVKKNELPKYKPMLGLPLKQPVIFQEKQERQVDRKTPG
jgi:hypothetical protein